MRKSKLIITTTALVTCICFTSCSKGNRDIQPQAKQDIQLQNSELTQSNINNASTIDTKVSNSTDKIIDVDATKNKIDEILTEMAEITAENMEQKSTVKTRAQIL